MVFAASEPEVQTIQEGRTFRMEHFTMDGEILLECRQVSTAHPATDPEVEAFPSGQFHRIILLIRRVLPLA